MKNGFPDIKTKEPLRFFGERNRLKSSHPSTGTEARRRWSKLFLFLILSGLGNYCLAGGSEAAPLFPLTILHTNDWHGTLDPAPALWMGASCTRLVGGAGALGRALKWSKLTALVRGGRYLLVDSGDLFQGSLEANLSKGSVIIDLYNSLGYIFAAVGNHDLDYGQPRMREAQRQSKFRWLAANLSGRNPTWGSSGRLRIGPLQIGFIGSTLIVQTRGYGSHLGVMTLFWNPETRQVATWTYQSILLDAKLWPPDPEIEKVLAPSRELAAKQADEILRSAFGSLAPF